jgi:3-deoxy-manno-octulosonate cytidylyltransferase (CMP-KDO synthetase)
MQKKVLAVIPARLGSTRIPEKMLEDICGKTLIERTIERTKKSKKIDKLVVTTDSEKIRDEVESLGVEVVMTPSEIPTGTDRVGEVLKNFKDFDPEIVANVWGDEPLFSANVIDDCIDFLYKNKNFDVVTAADKMSDKEFLNSDSTVKVTFDRNGKVMNLSRSVVPYHYNKKNDFEYYHIIGVMAWRTDFFKKFLELPQSDLEKIEGVEQLRIIENGYQLGVIKGEFNNVGVNTPKDLDDVRKICESLK